ncbi:MAG: response regulator receiver [Gemmatimonadetes bacterium]|jgi:DNA-binding response OmpR family regulator|nr:response regulator receiver [Gemmatimonadota bacterium]
MILAMTRILLIEDNEDLAFGLQRTLEAEGYDVTVAVDGPAGIAQVEQVPPTLVILDLMLPGMDGYQVLRSIRQGGYQMPVLILTARGEEADKVIGFRLGADDYVTKPFGLSELLARVNALLRRARNVVPEEEELAFGQVAINLAAHTVTKGGEKIALTPKEFELLVTLRRRAGVVVTRPALLKEVWGHQADVMTRTVDIHIAELRRKLEDDPGVPRHLVTVWKTGYRLDV